MSVSFWGKKEELNWPALENGEPEPPALLCDAGSKDDLHRVMMLMRGYGIPAIEKMPDGRPFSTVLFGSEIIGGAVYVPASLVEDARVLMSAPPEAAGETEEPE